jgi:hypothetical protein
LSSDNGIYLGEFPTLDGGKEYRVVHAQAIENVDFGDPDMQDHTRVSYFGNAHSYRTFVPAWEEAHRLANDIINDSGLLEYGIQLLEFDRPLINKTMEEADAWLDKKWKEEFPLVSNEVDYDIIEEVNEQVPFLDESEYHLVESPPLPKLKFSELRNYPGMNGFPAKSVSNKK